MIKLELYPLEHEPDYIATIWHSQHGVAASMRYEYKSKLTIRRYLCGLEEPNYPVPAISQCQWCGSQTNVCEYNGDGYWCPELCFQLN